MKIDSTEIQGVNIIELSPVSDHRGAFARLFCEKELASVIDDRRIVQMNHSQTNTIGALRGMHFQYPPHAEMKLIHCLRGRVFDVAVDLRKHSPTFLKWYARELSPDSPCLFIIPEGCAHGFQVLEENSELLYLHTAFYNKSAEGGIRYDDPLVGIQWPIPVTDISEKDRNHELLDKNFSGIDL